MIVRTHIFLKELNKEISKIDKELVLIEYIKTIEKEGIKCGLGIHQRYQILTDKKRLTKEIIKGIVSRFPLGKEIKEQLESQETK
ncbi:Uncharacterised protein [Streptococcus pyogenes]|nr:Uncharacterised protein [Streptococcus pyogenes]